MRGGQIGGGDNWWAVRRDRNAKGRPGSPAIAVKGPNLQIIGHGAGDEGGLGQLCGIYVNGRPEGLRDTIDGKVAAVGVTAQILNLIAGYRVAIRVTDAEKARERADLPMQLDDIGGGDDRRIVRHGDLQIAECDIPRDKMIGIDRRPAPILAVGGPNSEVIADRSGDEAGLGPLGRGQGQDRPGRLGGAIDHPMTAVGIAGVVDDLILGDGVAIGVPGEGK